MPYLENRLLSVIRCPEGIGSGCFWERHEKITTGFLHEFEVTHNNKSLTYSYITEEKGLLHLIQFGALELHVWGSKIEAINKPDNIVFDLDPSPETSWEKVLEGAREIHSSLKKLDLEAFVRLTGGKGLHVVIPIKPQLEWEPIKAFARAFAENTAKKMPELFVAQAAKAKREGKIFIDYLRNDLTATAITTFSTRANEGATVAVPLGWQELESTLEPATFTIPEVLMRIRKQKSNPWKSFFSVTQTLSKALLKEFNVS